jgi:FMN reductase
VSHSVVLVGNPRPASRTRALAEAAHAALVAAGAVPAGVTVLDLAEIAAVSFGPQPAIPVSPVDSPHEMVRAARLLIVATPTYKGVYSGLLKIFLDQYGHGQLAGIVAVPVAIAASEAHQASVAAALIALLDELGATVPAPALSILEPAAADPAQAAQAWVDQYGTAVAAALS